MLVLPADKAGIPIPEDPNLFDEVRENYPKFALFCYTSLFRSTNWGEHWDNAKVIAGLTDEEVKTITPEQLRAKGFRGI